MKKLIIACAAVLVLGLGLTTVGHVLGGQFYSVYYNGALHPFSDAAQNFSDKFVNISDHLVTADDDDDSDFDTDCRMTIDKAHSPGYDKHKAG